MKTGNDDPKNTVPVESELRTVGDEELARILGDHKSWVNALHSNEGTGGVPADLNRVDLTGADLRGVTLYRAKLQGTDLRDVDLRTADLREADLSGANLLRTKLQGSDLQDADLREVQSLLGTQLAGATISGAKLPDDILKFTGLENVEEISQNARKTFFGLLLGCVYVLLTIATTTDPLLISNSSSSPLPIVRAEIPIASFYWAAPLLLVGLFFYFHLYLQRLWEGLAALPAIFPDGEPLDKKAYPWLLIGLARRHIFRLRKTRPRFSRLQTVLSILLAWWTVPATILVLWIRYLPRHDWYGTLLHITLNIVAIGSGILFYHAAAATLRGEESRPLAWKTVFRDAERISHGAIVVGIGALFFMLSFGAIQGVRGDTKRSADLSAIDVRLWVPRIMVAIGRSPFADLMETDMSTKPENWTGEKWEELKFVKGARLRKTNLTYAQARQAFLANADLREADLTGADLTGADLRGANMEGANLRYADLNGADLREANIQGVDLSESNLRNSHLGAVHGRNRQNRPNLRGAKLQNVDLEEMNFSDLDLRGANFVGAQLRGANFKSAELKGAKFIGVDLRGAKLGNTNLEGTDFEGARLEQASFESASVQGANFRSATGLNRKAFVETGNWILAYYDKETLSALGLHADHSERIRRKDFRDMDFQDVKFSRPNLENFDLQNANLQKANLGRANLRGANLQGANLRGANLEYADLRGVKLRGAILQECKIGVIGGGQLDLSGFNFQGMNFRGARFHQVNFKGANFQGADLTDISVVNSGNFEGADLRGAKLGGAHLLNARGLTCKQIEGAEIDKGTILRSNLKNCPE